MTYKLDATGTSYGDGTAKFLLRHTDRPDTIICAMRLPAGDMGFWNKLLNAQAEKAWEEGAEAQARAYGMDKDTGPNPYTVQQ